MSREKIDMPPLWWIEQCKLDNAKRSRWHAVGLMECTWVKVILEDKDLAECIKIVGPCPREILEGMKEFKNCFKSFIFEFCEKYSLYDKFDLNLTEVENWFLLKISKETKFQVALSFKPKELIYMMNVFWRKRPPNWRKAILMLEEFRPYKDCDELSGISEFIGKYDALYESPLNPKKSQEELFYEEEKYAMRFFKETGYFPKSRQ